MSDALRARALVCWWVMVTLAVLVGAARAQMGIGYPRIPKVAHDSPLLGASLIDAQFNPQTGHMYLRTRSATSKAAAQALARELGGHLVCITDAAENAFILGAYGGLESYWIGASDEGHEGRFTWESGEPFSYANWGTPQEPNNSHYHHPSWYPENDIVFNQHRAGGWNDMSRIYMGPFRAIVEVPALYVGLYARGQGQASGAASYGHAFLSFVQPVPGGYSDLRLGLYPTVFDLILQTFNFSCIHFESGSATHPATPWECRILYWVSAPQYYSIALSVLRDMSPGLACPSRTYFSSVAHNCTNWAIDKLAAGGIQAPPHTTLGIADPDALVAAMHAMSGPDRPDCNGGTAESATGPQPIAYMSLVAEAMSAPSQLASRFGLSVLRKVLPAHSATLGSPLTIQITGIAPTDAIVVTDWGDGTRSYQDDLSHTYATPGAYQARLAIVDQGSVTHYDVAIAVGVGAGQSVIPVAHPIANATVWQNRDVVPAPGFDLPAAAVAIGSACGAGAASGLFATLPILGRTLTLTAANGGNASATGAILLGPEASPPLPLPGGCGSRVDYSIGVVGLPWVVPSQSRSELLVPLPVAPALLGARIAVQSILFDGPTRLATSTALLLILGT
jgi:hypothetical protein